MKNDLKKTLLLVEDEVLIAMGKKIKLEEYGYNVLTVNTGEKAVALTKENEDIDLILMDIDLGKGIDGTEAARQILIEIKIPIVFLSSHMEPEIVEKTENITSYGYVVKNSSITVLDASIKMAFKLFKAKIKEKLKEQELLQSEEQFRLLFDNAVAGIAIHKIVLDESGNPIDYIFLDVNKGFEKSTGLFKKDIIGLPVTQVIPGIEKTSFIKTYGDVVATGKSITFDQYSELLKRHYSINAYRVAPGQFATAFTDITEQKQSQEALRDSENKFRNLFEQAGDYIILWEFTKDRGFIVADANKATLEFHGYSKDDFIGTSMKDLDKGGLDKKQLETLQNRIMSGETVLFESVHGNKDGSTFPIEISSKLFKSEDDSTFIMAIERDITARKKMENVLREEQKRLSAILSTVGDPIFVKDNDHRFILANRAMYDMHGYKEEDVIGKTLGEQLPAEEMEHFLAVDRQVLDTGIPNVCEEHLTAKDGVQLTIITRKTRLLEESGKKFLVGSIHDITEIRRAESAQLKSEARYRELYEKSPLGYHSLDIDGRFVEANPSLCNLLGFERNEIIGKWFGDFLTSDSIETFKENFPKFKKKGEVNSAPFSLLAKNGQVISTEIEGIIAYDQNGHFKQTHCVIQNITKQKKAETNLLKSEYYLTKAQEIGKIGTWELDIRTNNLIWTDQTYEIFGVPIGTKIDNEFFLNCIYPGDRDYFQKKWSGGLNNEPYDIEHRIIVNDEIKWIREKAEININTEGKPTIAIGFAQDITEYKKAEIKLIESEKRFRDIAESIADWIWEVDIEGRFTFCSESVVSILGYSPKEIIGKTAYDLMCPEEKRPISTILRECLIARKPIKDLENWNLTKDGRRVCLLTNGTPILDKDGNFIGYRGVDVDITERKLAEEILLKSEDSFNNIILNSPDMIMLADNNGKITYISPQAENVIGHKAEKFIGLNFPAEYIYPDDVEMAFTNQKKVMQGEEIINFEYRFFNENGELQWLNHTARAIKHNGKILSIQNNVQNITKYKKAEEKIQQQLAEKEIILKESHHRIKNNFATIASLLSLQSNSLTNPEAIAALNNAIGRVNSMQILYEKLLLTGNYKTTSTKTYLDNLIDDITGFFPKDIDIKIERKIDDLQLDSKQLFPIGLIINELLTNKMKYAFTNRDSGLIEVVFKERNGDVILTVKDDGNELPEGFDIAESNGFGLMLVKMLVEQLGGNFTMENHSGVKSTIKFCV